MNNDRDRGMLSQHGFSLLELLVALTIFGIALVGISPLFVVAVETNDFTQSSLMSTELARGKMEALKALYEIELSTGVNESSLTLGSHGPETVTLGSSDNSDETPRDFALSWEVTDLGGLKRQVAISVKPAAFEDPESQAPTRAKTVVLTGALAP